MRRGRRPGKATQAARVLALYLDLDRGRRLRVRDAARELGVSGRQIQLDLRVVGEYRALRGLPPLERDDETGEWHRPGPAPDGSVRRAQVLALELGARLSAFLWSREPLAALEAQLGALRERLPKAERQRLARWRCRVAVIAPGQKTYASSAAAGRRLDALLRAMVECRAVTLRYRSHQRRRAGARARALVVHPLGIAFYRDGLYFIVDVARSSPELGGERRLLALDRIEDEDLAAGNAGAFAVPSDFDAAAFFGDAFGIFPEGAAQRVVIEVDADAAPWVLERTLHPSEEIEQRTDGTVRITLRIASRTEVIDWVLGFGEHAEIVEPPALRERIGARLAAAAGRYRAGS